MSVTTVAGSFITVNTIDSDHYVDGSIDTVHLGANQIDGTKLAIASQAAGDIMYYNGTDWIRLAKGTADQVFTMNDGATAPGWETLSAGGDLSFGGDTFGADKVIGSNDAYDLGFETTGATRMTIDSGGKIGIGLTSPAKMLHLLSSSNSDKTAVVRVESTGQGATGFQLFGPGDAASNAKKFEILSLRENATDPAKFRISSLNDSEGAVATIMEMTHAGEVTVKENTSMPSVPKGIAKMWCSYAQAGSQSITRSYNVAGISDGGGAGDTDLTWTVDFENETGNVFATMGNGGHIHIGTDDSSTASGITGLITNHSGSSTDQQLNNIVGFGEAT